MSSLDNAIKAFRDSPSESNLAALRAEVDRVEEQTRMSILELDIKLAVLKYLGKA